MVNLNGGSDRTSDPPLGAGPPAAALPFDPFGGSGRLTSAADGEAWTACSAASLYQGFQEATDVGDRLLGAEAWSAMLAAMNLSASPPLAVWAAVWGRSNPPEYDVANQLAAIDGWCARSGLD